MFDGAMMKTMMKMVKPHLNSIGEGLVKIQEERQIPEPADVRIVILAKRDAEGKVHTFMQHVITVPNPMAEYPNVRQMDILLDGEGQPMHVGIEGLMGMLGQS